MIAIDHNDRCLNCMEAKSTGLTCPHCGYREVSAPESAYHLAPGTLLHDKYLLGKVLGQGGFGITYLALDTNLDLKLAIKEFYPRGLVSRVPGQNEVSAYTGALKSQYTFGLERFLSEAKTLARFSEHPNIVTVRDFFRANGTAYMVMNYVEGVTFEEYLNQKGGSVTYKQTLGIIMPVLDALKEIHETGIMHRDISPDNIYIDTVGRVILIDFGAARLELLQKSRSLSVIMKAGYSPEEQYRSRGVQGPWTDIYAAAATIYRAVSGQMPPESLDRLEEDNLIPPSALGVDIDSNSEEVLLKALAVKSNNRYRSVEELQEALLKKEPPAAPAPSYPEDSLSEELAIASNVAVTQAAGLTSDPTAIAKHTEKLSYQKYHSLFLAAVFIIAVLFLLPYGIEIYKNNPPKLPMSSTNVGYPIILYKEDFSDENINNWDIQIDYPVSENAGWKITEEADNYCLEGRGHAFARPPVENWDCYTISFRFKLLQEAFRINLRENTMPNYSRYLLDISEGGLYLEKETLKDNSYGSNFIRLTEYEKHLELNHWHSLKALVQGNNIRVYIEDDLVIDYFDESNPYLSGIFSFETIGNAIALIDDIIVVDESFPAIESNIEEQDQVFIPSLQTYVEGIRFFNSKKQVVPLNERIYSLRFLKEETRYIGWELVLSHLGEQETEFTIYAEYYSPSGEIINQGIVYGLEIESGWTDSLHSSGYGYLFDGLWEPGEYHIKLYIEEELIATSSFVIV